MKRRFDKRANTVPLETDFDTLPLTDWYLSRDRFQSQQTDQPRGAARPDNLWSPVNTGDRGDFGAHGNVDNRASDSCPMLEVVKLQTAVRVAVLAGVGMLATAWLTKRSV